MKTTIENGTPVFSPITISITLDTEEEVKELWHRLNHNGMIIKDLYSEVDKKRYTWNPYKSDSYNFWSTIDKIALQFGIKP